ncbi:hypothetical protein CA951_24715 [Rhodococcus sp. NCIMB 12038]|nr:hypothetical protein CA951_24715 [Rhodococcus sp. NCIMB 12038]
MQSEPVISECAYKDGIDSGDMVHAFNKAITAFDLGEGFIVLVGPALDAPLLEFGYITSTDAPGDRPRHEARPSYLR